MTYTIFIGSDHAGFDLKNDVVQFLKHNYDCDVHDVGCKTHDAVDYPIIAQNVCKRIFDHNSGNDDYENTFGILICGTGQGMAMSANRQIDIRAGIAWNSDIAKLMREHNNANVLCLPARHLSFDETKNIVDTFLKTLFSSEERHIRRIHLL